MSSPLASPTFSRLTPDTQQPSPFTYPFYRSPTLFDLPKLSDKPVYAPDSTLINKITAYVTDLKNQDFFSGTILVAQGAKVLIHTSIQPLQGPKQVPFSRATPFNILAIGQLFTRVAIMQLVERELIQLDQPLRSILGKSDYLFDKSIKQLCEPEDFAAHHKVSVRHLLTHTAGLIEDATNVIFEEELIGQHSYSPYGFELLARVIQRASGQSFKEYISSHIFKDFRTGQIRMPSALAYSKQAPKFNQRADHFHFSETGESQHIYAYEQTISAPNGNGGWWMNAADIFAFLQALAHNQLINQSTKEKMLTTSAKKGSFHRTNPDMYDQPGSGREASSGILVIEGQKPITVVCLSNYSYGNAVMADIKALAFKNIFKNIFKDLYSELSSCSDSKSIQDLIKDYGIETESIFEEITLADECLDEKQIVATFLADAKEALAQLKDNQPDEVH
jgi:CubicO group peptidase (beta-lactamase class C family)